MSSSRNQPNQTCEKPSGNTLRKGVTFFTATCIVATIGYVLAGWDWIDAIYMVTITIFGVGYGEVKPIEGPWLKFFTIGVILAGCSSLIYVVGGIVQLLTEGEIRQMLGQRSRSRGIDQLSDHTIICGYGRVGQMLAEELARQNALLVILDQNHERIDQAIQDGFLALQGDAIDDNILCQAGLLRAKTLATVLPNDANNVFITLTARDLSDSIRIIARAECPSTERKLLRGGASSVVMPSAIGAVRIAQLAISPSVDETQLPEDRFRIIGQTNRQGMVDADTHEVAETKDFEKAVQSEVEELAQLAEDLTRSVVQRQNQEISETHG